MPAGVCWWARVLACGGIPARRRGVRCGPTPVPTAPFAFFNRVDPLPCLPTVAAGAAATLVLRAGLAAAPGVLTVNAGVRADFRVDLACPADRADRGWRAVTGRTVCAAARLTAG